MVQEEAQEGIRVEETETATEVILEEEMGKWVEKAKWARITWIHLRNGQERTIKAKESKRLGIVGSDVSLVVEGAMPLPAKEFMHNARI